MARKSELLQADPKEARYDHWDIQACLGCGLVQPSIVSTGFTLKLLKDYPKVGDILPDGSHCSRCWAWTTWTVIAVFQQKVRAG